MTQKITIWQSVSIDKDGKTTTEHNHCEEGWVNDEYPLPLNSDFTKQKTWKNQKWKKSFGYSHNGKVIVDERLEKWLITQTRYLSILNLLKNAKLGLKSEGNSNSNIVPCAFCSDGKQCSECDWSLVFGLCISAGGNGDATYVCARNHLTASITGFELILKRINERIDNLKLTSRVFLDRHS